MEMNERFLSDPQKGRAVDTLLFDLGAVLYEIDLERSVRAFHVLVPEEMRAEFPSASEILAYPVFREFEKGAISPDRFRQTLRELFGIAAGDAEIDHAWNQVLVGLLPEKESLVARLGQRYRLLLLSNTNQIHYEHFVEECGELFGHMETCFFSHEMKLRKPDPEIYRTVLREKGLEPGKVLFIDDNKQNLAGAGEVGLQLYHYSKMADLEQLTDHMFNILR